MQPTSNPKSKAQAVSPLGLQASSIRENGEFKRGYKCWFFCIW